MALEDKHKLESVFIQRDPSNDDYAQVNISGSDLIIYHSASGELTADRISVWAAKYNIGTGDADTASYMAFDGDRSITRTPHEGINVGTNNVVDFLDRFFFPFVPATVAITSPSSTTYYETGSVQNRLVRTRITANEETLFESGSVKRSGLDWNTISAPATPGINIDFTDTGLSSSHTYQSFISASNNGSPTVIASSIRAVNFIYPYLWGMSTTAGLSGQALYSAMTKTVEIQGTKSTSFVGVSTYIYFCYPESYPDLTLIKDPNNFEVLPSFEFSASVPVTSSGYPTEWMSTYKVYRLILHANPNGTFNFYH